MASAPARSSRSFPRASAGVALALTLAAGGTSAAFGNSEGAEAAPTAECTTDGFCEDFESQTGTQPSGRWSAGAPDCTGTGSASVDSSVAHTGSQSIRVNGGTGYCNHMFVGTELTDVAVDSGLYVRFWMRHSTPLPTQHVTFLAMEDAAHNNSDLRMGGQNSAMQWNREYDDATLPAQSPVGVSLSVPLPTDEWVCVEYQIDPAGLLETWVNGESVEGLHLDGTPTQDVDQQWMNGGAWQPDLTDLRFGWESYGEGSDTLWYDDIAVGTTRVGC
jgi:hypothetical protein